MEYIASCSGGRDSVATLIVAKIHGEPLDEVVYCEVMFDQETSGEVPEHRGFIYETLKPWVERELQVPFVIVRSKKTYVDCFGHRISKGPAVGKIHGFAIPGMCLINRDCKIPPIRAYWKSKGQDVTQYIGIEWEEEKRLARLAPEREISLLEKYRITRKRATELCHEYGLYSPTYEVGKRNGCWFCPNCQDDEWARLIYKHEELFEKLLDLEREAPERYRQCLTVNETPSQLKARILSYGEQLRFEDLAEEWR